MFPKHIQPRIIDRPALMSAKVTRRSCGSCSSTSSPRFRSSDAQSKSVVAQASEFFFVMLDALFEVVFSVAQYSVNQSSQMVGHGDDGLWRAKSGAQAPILGPQGAFAVTQALSTQAQGVGGTVINLASGSA